MPFPPALLEEARRHGKIIEHNETLQYSRFREDFRAIPRGTVLLHGRVVFGFPHIPRIFTLEKGIERNLLPGSFYVEEKIDGFNLRILQHEKAVYAFSRGGFLDLFATEKAREMELEPFFRDYPDHALCGEMIGNTPYTRPTRAFDVRFFVFDIQDGEGAYLPCEEKYALLKHYRIRGVMVHGRFEQADSVPALALRLMKKGAEGMVLKSADRKKIVKFVNPYADIEDIAHNAALLFDMPSGFFLQRVLRSAIFLRDLGLSRQGYSLRLGRAFYDGLSRGFDQIEREGHVSEEFAVQVRNPDIWDAILRHTSSEVRLVKISQKKQGKYYRIRFKKIYKRTSQMLRDFLRGKSLVD